MASSTTPIPPMRADWMASGVCTSGSTAPPCGATRQESGGSATTSTAIAEPTPVCPCPYRGCVGSVTANDFLSSFPAYPRCRLAADRRDAGALDALAGDAARRSERGWSCLPDRRRAPVHRVEGTTPCLLPGGAGVWPYVAGGRRHGLATRRASRPPLQLLLCRPDGDPPRHRGHGPARDGCRDGSHHRRTSRTGR